MKYVVKFICGHEEVKELFGKTSEREKRIKWWEENCVCSECYRQMEEEEILKTCEELTIKYYDYKNKPEYKNLKSKKGSYNPEDKTIIVYVNKGED